MTPTPQEVQYLDSQPTVYCSHCNERTFSTNYYTDEKREPVLAVCSQCGAPRETLQARVAATRAANRTDVMNEIYDRLTEIQECPGGMCGHCIEILCEQVLPIVEEARSLKGRVREVREAAAEEPG